MAILLAYGDATGDTDGVVDLTNEKFEAPLSMLLPNGWAWPPDDAVRKTLIRAITREYSRQAIRGDKLLNRELNPATTFECLTDWEESYGLPDCAQPTTLEGRRAAIAAKVLAQAGHSQTLEFWTELFAKVGYELEYIVGGEDAMTCEDDCEDVLFEDEVVYLWSLVTQHGLEDALLECLIGHNSWIGTYPILHFAWEVENLGLPTIYGIACTPGGYIAGVGSIGVKIYSSDLGGPWGVVGGPLLDLYAVCAVGETLVAVGDSAIDAVFSTDGGASWSSSFGFAAPTLYGISRGPFADQVVVAVGVTGAMWRSTDAGLFWGPLPTITPTKTLYAVTRCTGTMIAVGEGGTVLRSVDNGITWVLVAAGITIDLRAVSAWENVVIAVGEEIWRSEDSGLTWTNLTTGGFLLPQLRAITSSPTGRWIAGGTSGFMMSSPDGIEFFEEVVGANEIYAACAYTPGGRAVLAGDRITLE